MIFPIVFSLLVLLTAAVFARILSDERSKRQLRRVRVTSQTEAVARRQALSREQLRRR